MDKMNYELLLEDEGIKYQIIISSKIDHILINRFHREEYYDEYFSYDYHLSRSIFKSKIIWELGDDECDQEVIDYCDKLVHKLYNLKCFM